MTTDRLKWQLEDLQQRNQRIEQERQSNRVSYVIH
jgi:hypothetical protein